MNTRLFTIFTLLFFATPLLYAQSTQVKIVGPDAAYTTHDMTTIASDLDAMLKATSGRSGSAASATVLSGLSLIETYYHPSYRNATRAVPVTCKARTAPGHFSTSAKNNCSRRCRRSRWRDPSSLPSLDRARNSSTSASAGRQSFSLGRHPRCLIRKSYQRA